MKYFRYKNGRLPTPVFFPDATRGVIRCLDTSDIESTHTSGILVNTYHLYREVGFEGIKKFGGVRKFMGFKGAVISDSGGFQVGSLVKKNPALGKVSDEGVLFNHDGMKIMLTPEESIRFQMETGADMVVVLDDFDAPNATEEENKKTVDRTIDWARRSKEEFEKVCRVKKIPKDKRPYILGVVQGGRYKNLRKYCIDRLTEIGFDGLGYGGEEKVKGNVNYDLAEFVAQNTPKDYFLYALGVGKPDNVVRLARLGYNIFDCVLPTRDARHKRLYVFNAPSVEKIDLSKPDFYRYFVPDKKENVTNNAAVSSACDCLLCQRYSRAYLAHLFKIGDFTAGRLSTIHNLRFYSILMEELQASIDKK